jgi:hypothetical protein
MTLALRTDVQLLPCTKKKRVIEAGRITWDGIKTSVGGCRSSTII